ncbi:MAG: hypothetical protein KBF45_03965 [Cyclobacteriaceae bacterium]|jgi:hypothetical protein|nr:hypothetical protein [Cyclobacteriaceae bacterium]
MMQRTLFFVGSLFLLASCNKSNLKYEKPYFDFDSLINVQSADLIKAGTLLSKSVSLNGKQDQSSIQTDSTLMAHELDVFRQLDVINKPLYKTAYEILDGDKDSRSNLRIRTYKAKNPSPVPFITFYYLNDWKHLKKIESVYQENNTLYLTERHLQLEFDDVAGTLLLSRYEVTGKQKMILSDTVLFSIEGSFLPLKD